MSRACGTQMFCVMDFSILSCRVSDAHENNVGMCKPGCGNGMWRIDRNDSCRWHSIILSGQDFY
jgi:hypothetical protein